METLQSDTEQARLWNGSAAQAWIDGKQLLDQILMPFEDLLVAAVSAAGARQILDVGCGTGSTTLAIAELLGSAGRCVGVDISEPMIADAHTHGALTSAPASFICADAQTHAFVARSFDMIVSRFGTMFFEDSVQAFGNLRRAVQPDGGLRFIAWRSAAENPFMTTAERAAAPYLPNIPPRRTDAPGQFAFADQRRIHGILERSGWAGIDIRPIDVICTLPERHLNHYLTRMGPLGLALEDADDATRAKVTKTVRAAFAPYVHGAEVRFTAACWTVGARSPR